MRLQKSITILGKITRLGSSLMNEEPASKIQEYQSTEQLIIDINVLIARIEQLRAQITLYLLLNRSRRFSGDFGLDKRESPK